MALSYIRHLLVHVAKIFLRLFAIVMSRRTENILSSQALCLPLPEEVIYEILTWLPVKSLIQFRCVSKSWNSIITNPIFITTHLNRVNKRANKTKTMAICYLHHLFIHCTTHCILLFAIVTTRLA